MQSISQATTEYFESSSFQIEQPLLQWNENYRISNERGETVFACRRRRMWRELMAAAFAMLCTVILMVPMIVVFATLLGKTAALIVILVPPVVLGFGLFFKLRGRRNIEIYADTERQALIFTVRQDQLFPTIAPSFTLLSSSNEIIGIIKKQGVTLIGEGWKIMAANYDVLAHVKENVTNSLIGDLAVLKEGRNQVSRFTVQDATSGTPICELAKGVFNFSDSYRLEGIIGSRVSPVLLVALVLVLDTTFFAEKSLPQPTGVDRW